MHDLRGGTTPESNSPKVRLKKRIRRALVYIPLMITLGKYLNWDMSQDLKEML